MLQIFFYPNRSNSYTKNEIFNKIEQIKKTMGYFKEYAELLAKEYEQFLMQNPKNKVCQDEKLQFHMNNLGVIETILLKFLQIIQENKSKIQKDKPEIDISKENEPYRILANNNSNTNTNNYITNNSPRVLTERDPRCYACCNDVPDVKSKKNPQKNSGAEEISNTANEHNSDLNSHDSDSYLSNELIINQVYEKGNSGENSFIDGEKPEIGHTNLLYQLEFQNEQLDSITPNKFAKLSGASINDFEEQSSKISSEIGPCPLIIINQTSIQDLAFKSIPDELLEKAKVPLNIIHQVSPIMDNHILKNELSDEYPNICYFLSVIKAISRDNALPKFVQIKPNSQAIKIQLYDWGSKKLEQIEYQIKDNVIKSSKIPSKEESWIRATGQSLIQLIQKNKKVNYQMAEKFFLNGGRESDIFFYLTGDMVRVKYLNKYEESDRKYRLVNLMIKISRDSEFKARYFTVASSKPNFNQDNMNFIKPNHSYIIDDFTDCIRVKDPMNDNKVYSLSIENFLACFDRMVLRKSYENYHRTELRLTEFNQASWTTVKFKAKANTILHFQIWQRDLTMLSKDSYSYNNLQIMLIRINKSGMKNQFANENNSFIHMKESFNIRLNKSGNANLKPENLNKTQNTPEYELIWIKSTSKEVVAFNKKKLKMYGESEYLLIVNVDWKYDDKDLFFLGFSNTKLLEIKPSRLNFQDLNKTLDKLLDELVVNNNNDDDGYYTSPKVNNNSFEFKYYNINEKFTSLHKYYQWKKSNGKQSFYIGQ